jgi:hypothetical protein
VQGDPPSRPGHGDLRQPAPQAAPGLSGGERDLAPPARGLPKAPLDATPAKHRTAVRIGKKNSQHQPHAADIRVRPGRARLPPVRRPVPHQDEGTDREQTSATIKETARWHVSWASTSRARSAWRSH